MKSGRGRRGRHGVQVHRICHAFKVQAARRCRWRDVSIRVRREQGAQSAGRAPSEAHVDHRSDEKPDHVMEKAVCRDHKCDAAGPRLPDTEAELAPVVVVRRRRALDGKAAEAVAAAHGASLTVQDAKVQWAAQSPLPIVSKRSGSVVIGTNQIAVPALQGAVSRMKRGVHFLHVGTADVAGENSVERSPETLCGPVVRHDDASGLTKCVNASVCPTGPDHGHLQLHQPRKPLFEYTLDGSLGGLSLPPGKGLAIILKDQLEGAARHCWKDRPHGK
jgi:hypothetical protein